jgi:hypothetical protein
MKKIVCTLVTALLFTAAYAQKTVLQVQLSSGLFAFSGKSTQQASAIIYNEQPNKARTSNPYGSKYGLCYGIAGSIKRVTKHHILFGTDVGFEVLRSKTDINTVYASTNSINSRLDANGHTFLNHRFINLHPFVGYRIIIRTLPVDLSAGLDLGYIINAKEKGKATTSDGTIYKTSRERETIRYDIRPRFQIATQYRKLGVYGGYSINGLNYQSRSMGGFNDCYARLIRFGLTYQLN